MEKEVNPLRDGGHHHRLCEEADPCEEDKGPVSVLGGPIVESGHGNLT